MRLVQTVLSSLLVHKQHKPHSLVPRSLTFNPSICLLMQYCKQYATSEKRCKWETLQVRNATSEKRYKWQTLQVRNAGVKGQSILKQGYNLHHWSLDGCWLAYLLKMLGPPCMSRTLTIRNATVNTPSAAALLKSPLSHFGRLCGSEKKVQSSSIPEFRFICMEWSRNTIFTSNRVWWISGVVHLIEDEELISDTHSYNSDSLLLAQYRTETEHQSHCKPPAAWEQWWKMIS